MSWRGFDFAMTHFPSRETKLSGGNTGAIQEVPPDPLLYFFAITFFQVGRKIELTPNKVAAAVAAKVSDFW